LSMGFIHPSQQFENVRLAFMSENERWVVFGFDCDIAVWIIVSQVGS
jgi:hypothetical protein